MPTAQSAGSPFSPSAWTPAQQVRGATNDPSILVAQAAAAAGEIVDSTVVEKEPPLPRAAVQASGIDANMVDAIKLAIQQKQRFLAELVEHAYKWELEGSELRLYFSNASKTLAQMLEAREPLENCAQSSAMSPARRSASVLEWIQRRRLQLFAQPAQLPCHANKLKMIRSFGECWSGLAARSPKSSAEAGVKPWKSKRCNKC